MEKITFPKNLRWIAIQGDPVDGFDYYGPFKSTEDANDWASSNLQPDWWVADLHRP